jgi:hypothetical protein
MISPANQNNINNFTQNNSNTNNYQKIAPSNNYNQNYAATLEAHK